MKKIIIIILAIAFVLEVLWLAVNIPINNKIVFYSQPAKNFWQVQAIDTMKYSRDLAAEKLMDASFDAEIERQMRAIAATGATHVAIGTPYDEKFFSFLKRWVAAARRYKLNVWFRGNWSGWEGWFGFQKKVTRTEHVKKTAEFIKNHTDIFADGDIFSSCPESENGGPGDPRHNNDVAGHRQFLIAEYAATKEAFAAIKKNVASNYFSMNGDVARLIMNPETTRALDGIVTIDHYVATPKKLAEDIHDIARVSGGQVMLGEWGVAIPDIHGKMSEAERVEWMESALKEMAALKGDLIGLNYWLAVGGGTELWSSKTETSQVSETLQKYYQPQTVYGRVADEFNNPIGGAQVLVGQDKITANEDGYFEWRGFEKVPEIEVVAEGYTPKILPNTSAFQDVILINEKPSLYFSVSLWFRDIFNL